ncbi:hypothetical protein CW745_14280 [Psychromonas sp. psych-6C06]|uniref:hypothetical protein n=1 Tax=Psychromonas sp. psych-6C06 TaxID=2058089 RepID=UPI000C33BA4E|nr:hypothetical protein [Psychromonas sp. psych-6C06]PKF60692.1 hypothetical protein CW745_14280 [Psychromonas sp. psych-6C06]
MSQSDLSVSSVARASTAEELDYLQHLLQRAMTPRKRLLKATLNFLVLWGFSLLGLLMVSGIASYLAQYSQILTNFLALPYLAWLSVIASGCYASFSSYRWLQKLDNPYPLILKDINTQQVIEETYHVQAVTRLQEPEFGGFIYCLKVDEKAVYVIYDYESQSNKKHVFPVFETLILNRALHSGHYLSHQFKGQPLVCSETLSLALPPDKWPLPETWLPQTWSNLKKHVTNAS